MSFSDSTAAQPLNPSRGDVLVNIDHDSYHLLGHLQLVRASGPKTVLTSGLYLVGSPAFAKAAHRSPAGSHSSTRYATITKVAALAFAADRQAAFERHGCPSPSAWDNSGYLAYHAELKTIVDAVVQSTKLAGQPKRPHDQPSVDHYLAGFEVLGFESAGA